MKRRLLVIGDSYMNIQMSVPGAARSYETVYGDSYSIHPCGNSAISAITAAKNGAECTFCTRLGNDMNGDKLLNYYKSCGIDVSFIKKLSNYQTGLWFSAYDNLHSLSYVTKGANLLLSKADIDDAFACFPDVLLISHDYITSHSNDVGNQNIPYRSEIDIRNGENYQYNRITEPRTSRPENLALYAVNKAMERGVELVLEYTETTAMLPLEQMTGIKVIVISEEMLKNVTGTAPISIEKTLSALISFSSKIKAKYYVVQKGNDTSFIYDGMYFEIPQAPAVLKSLSHQDYSYMHSTYVGAMMAEYMQSKDILRACKYAHIVSLMTRAPMGMFQRVPSRAQVMEFLNENNFSIDTL